MFEDVQNNLTCHTTVKREATAKIRFVVKGNLVEIQCFSDGLTPHICGGSMQLDCSGGPICRDISAADMKALLKEMRIFIEEAYRILKES